MPFGLGDGLASEQSSKPGANLASSGSLQMAKYDVFHLFIPICDVG